MEVDSIIPPTLITARDGFEAANRAWIAIREASVAPEAAARRAARASSSWIRRSRSSSARFLPTRRSPISPMPPARG